MSSTFGEKERTDVSGSIIFMIVAPEPDFARLQPAYEAMVKSVHFK